LAPDAYLAGLSLLSRRELSAAQVRQRLKARGFSPTDIEDAVERLLAAGALDDGRVARGYARTAAAIRGRGRARVIRELEAMGIDRAIAREAAGEAFEELDEEALLIRALDRKLRGRRIKDAAEFHRLHQFLMRQGFDAGRILKALKDRGGRPFDEES
jgi:regulatory protein